MIENKKNIVFVIRHFFPFTAPSGVTSVTKELIDEFKRRGTRVSVVCIRKTGEKKFYRYNGVDVYKFRQTKLWQYRKLINNIDSVNVLFISSMSTVSATLAWWLPIYIFTPKRKLLFYQATNFSHFRKSTSLKRFISLFENVFSASDDIFAKFSELGNDTDLMYPGISFGKIEKYTIPRKDKGAVIGFFGHLTYVKGVDNFIALAKKLPEINFVIVAGKNRVSREEEFSKGVINNIALLPNVKEFGYIQNPLEVMSQCTILVLPYRNGGTILGVAQSAIEAMAMGIPVVGTNNAALIPLVINGENGFLCSSITEMQERVKLLLLDDDLYQTISLGARRTVEQKFNIVKTVNKLEKYL